MSCSASGSSPPVRDLVKRIEPVHIDPASGMATFEGEAAWVLQDTVHVSVPNPADAYRVAGQASLRARSRRALRRASLGLFALFPMVLFALLVSVGPGVADLLAHPAQTALLLFGVPAAIACVGAPLYVVGYVLPARHAPPQDTEIRLQECGIEIRVGLEPARIFRWQELRVVSIEAWIHPRWGRGVIEAIALAASSDSPVIELRRTDHPGAASVVHETIKKLAAAGKLQWQRTDL